MNLRALWRGFRPGGDHGSWLEPGRILACSYPRRDNRLADLAGRGVSVVVNLHERPHDPARLARFGLEEVRLPVKDFSAPSPQVLEDGVRVIAGAIDGGKVVAVHCGAGLGRTGTLLACYLVDQGVDAGGAIARVRAVRPGSVETARQVAAIHEFAKRRGEARRQETDPGERGA